MTFASRDHGTQVLALVVGRRQIVSRTGRIIARVAKTLPKNAELADLLELLADLLELDGADAFRLAAYRKAATRIREAAVPVAQLALEGKATKLSGIGTTIENKIVEYTERPATWPHSQRSAIASPPVSSR